MATCNTSNRQATYSNFALNAFPCICMYVHSAVCCVLFYDRANIELDWSADSRAAVQADIGCAAFGGSCYFTLVSVCTFQVGHYLTQLTHLLLGRLLIPLCKSCVRRQAVAVTKFPLWQLPQSLEWRSAVMIYWTGHCNYLKFLLL